MIYVFQFLTKVFISIYIMFLNSNNDEKQRLYKLRHQNDYINDLNYPGCWSWWLLWNKKSIEESIKYMEKQFKINIIFN